MPASLAWPLNLAADGTLATVEQNTSSEIAQSAQLVLLTQPGERVDNPDFGLDDPAFEAIDAGAIVGALARWEPRADATAVIAGVKAGTVTVRVDVKFAGSP